MFYWNKSLVLLLVTFFTGVICDGCNEEAKTSFSLIFCDNAIHCSNTSTEQILKNFKDCISQSSREVVQLIEHGNRLEPSQCFKEMKKVVCKIVQDIKEKPMNYLKCISALKDVGSALMTCSATVSEAVDKLEPFAQIVCSDISKIKCESNEAMEAFNITKNCLTQNIVDIKDLINNQDYNQCKNISKHKLKEFIQTNAYKEFDKCMNDKNELVLNNNPKDKCIGFQ